MLLNKKTKHQNNNHSRKAAERTFTFFLLILLSHTIYEFYNSFTLNSSFYIMIGGLIFFFINDYLLSKYPKS